MRKENTVQKYLNQGFCAKNYEKVLCITQENPEKTVFQR